MNKGRTLLHDGSWVAGTQILSAFGQLLGMRLLTELISPGAFGIVSLWLGVVALVASGLANPTMQALLRFYPEYEQNGQSGLVRNVASKQLLKLFAFVGPVLMIGVAFYLYKNPSQWLLFALFLALSALEIVRMLNIAILSAIRAQRSYGLWQVLESWARPLLACLAVYLLGNNPENVLIAFLVASLVIWLYMRRYVPESQGVFEKVELEKTSSRIWKYTLPLLPLGIFGWMSGMADRYLIAGFMTAADVGIYVAAYGLASRPVLMMAGIIEITLRPIYHNAVIDGGKKRQNQILIRWLLMLLGGSFIIFLVSYFGHKWIATLLLGQDFRQGSYLIPWLVLGHIFLVLGQFLTRIQLANENTKGVALIEVSGAVIAVVCSYFLIQKFGLYGAVFAVIIGYIAQCGIAFAIFRLTHNQLKVQVIA